MHPSTSVLEAQPDWLTVVASGSRSSSSVLARAQTLMRGEKVNGNRQLPFSLGLYTGTRCGRVRCGESAGKALVQLSGDLAAVHLDWFLLRCDHVTRLDLAVTVQTPGRVLSLAETAYLHACAYRQDHPKLATPSVVLNGAGGQTFYIGKRTGDRYFRFYDKQAECEASKDEDAAARYARAWRYELELHDTAATNVAYALPPNPARAFWIESYLHGYLLDHGCDPIYTAGQSPMHVGGFRRRTDRESRLDWLSRSVAPTVQWLIESTPREELLKRLGLEEEEEAH